MSLKPQNQLSSDQVSPVLPVSSLLARRRRARLALGLAVAAVTTVSVARFSVLRAEEAPASPASTVQKAAVNATADATAAGTQLAAAPADPNNATLAAAAEPMGNKDRLAKGVSEYNNAQYEDALTDLQQVKPDMLGPSQQSQLTDYLSKADTASQGRKAAHAEYELGDQSLAANDPGTAAGHYHTAMSSKFIDDGTKAKCREQLAVADSMTKQSANAMKSVYASAVSDYKSGSYQAAKDKFTQLQASGFKEGLFQKSPGYFLKEIDKKMPAAPAMAEAAAAAPVAAAAAAPAAPEAPQVQMNAPAAPAPAMSTDPAAPTPATPAAPAPAMASNDQPAAAPAPAAPTPPPAAPEAPAAPAAPVASDTAAAAPATAPAMAQANSDNTAPMAMTPTTEPSQTQTASSAPATPDSTTAAPAPDNSTAMAAPEAPAMDAKTAYKTARDQYRKGDWIAARKSFVMAQSEGYKPGLFEDAPSKYLARMDAKEQHDAALAQNQTAGSPGEATTSPSDADAKKAEAMDLVGKAETARAAGKMDEALGLYGRALEADPSSQSATTGRDETLKLTGRTTEAADPLAVRSQQITQQRQYITYSVTSALDKAREAEAAQDFAAAQTSVEQARVARALNPGIFRDEELRGFDQQIADAQTGLDNAKEGTRLSAIEKSRSETEMRVAQQQAAKDAEIRRTVSELIRESIRLNSEGNYSQSVATLNQILKLDPRNEYALGALPLVQDRMQTQLQRSYRDKYNREVVQQYDDANEKEIPYNDILIFPQNWPDLSATRDKTVANERGEREEDQTALAQLEHKLPELHFDGVPFSDVIEFLREVSSANIFVNWKALDAAGVDRNTPVTARLRDVKFSKALETILRDVGGGTVKLGYTIDEGVITISTEEDLASNVVTRVYDIRDLIINVTDFDQPPTFNISTSTQTRGGGGGSSLFGGTTNGTQNQGTREQLVDQITKLIEDIVSSESWKDNGGSVGSIRELSGQLIVTQTPENQRQLVHLLEQLRETRAIQITVETRFLTVTRNFLEDIGVDFDFLLNPNGEISKRLSPIAVNNNTSSFTTIGNLGTGVPGNISSQLTAGTTAGSTVPGNLVVGNASGGAITFLDDFQVSLLVQATQASQNTTTLTAPRLTLFNGQRAFVAVTTESAYVSDLTPIVGTNAVAFQPTVAVIDSGVLLDVQATVSADRKYVTLTLRPTLQNLQGFATFPVVALTTVAGNGNGGASTVAQTAFLQQPTVARTLVNTTVSVPDGGTLLLGGETLAGDVERDSGVPILSKIPFLKRLFTNTGTAKDQQVLLILVKPTIVIEREREAEQFPLISAKTGG